MKSFFCCIFLFCFVISKVYAELVITELYPAPPSGQFEWVEIYNPATVSATLQEYSLIDNANNPIVIREPSIAPLGYIIATSSSVLNNSGDSVFLKKQNVVVSSATYSATLTSSQSFARCTDSAEQWMTTDTPTKLTGNNLMCIVPSITPTPTLIPTVTMTPTLTPTPTEEVSENYDIQISEIMPYPVGEKEWIELFNNEERDITLTEWFIDDEEDEGSSPKSFTITITKKGYAVVELSTSIFNNAGDTVRLLDSEENLVDAVIYEASHKALSLGRVSYPDTKICEQLPTRGSVNGTCFLPTLTPTPTIRVTPTPRPKVIVSATQEKIIPTHTRTSISPRLIITQPPIPYEEEEGEVLAVYDEASEHDLSGIAFGTSLTSILSAVAVMIKVIRALYV